LLKLLLVNNYDASNRERMLTLKASLARGGRVEVTDWNLVTSEKLREYDGVILSGSYDMLSSAKTQAKFARTTAAQPWESASATSSSATHSGRGW